MKNFDLNIDRVLENWSVADAIREIIANAIDEQKITGTKDITITKDGEGIWRIRDFGRGLSHEHLLMNECQEKLSHPHLIGKFGVGLKDALAIFDRLGIEVHIRSRYCQISLDRYEKHNFSDVITLHACIAPSEDSDFEGTEVSLRCAGQDIESAKRMFLRFSAEECIEGTEHGEILQRVGTPAYVYINGLRVAEEENFLFSYNITFVNAAIKKTLNRERTNVGRAAYTDRVKSILRAANSERVTQTLIEELQHYSTGKQHDELKWIDVAAHAARLASASDKVVFVTPHDAIRHARFIDEAQTSGRQVITIPATLQQKIAGSVDANGLPLEDLNAFIREWNDSFEFQFVSPEQLSPEEREVFKLTEKIGGLVGGLPIQIEKVRISETMRPEHRDLSEAVGLWNGDEIIIKRSQLESVDKYAAVLLHEIAHARSGATDVTHEFELELTRSLGLIASRALEIDASNTRTKSTVRQLPATATTVSPHSQVDHSRDTKRQARGFWHWLVGDR